jgi:hypothetical protein
MSARLEGHMLLRYVFLSRYVHILGMGMNMVPVCVVHWLFIFCNAS